jgi:ectoine hydroxylase-related dioxygenase (phytanoyl-CoA dioxygenase family)
LRAIAGWDWLNAPMLMRNPAVARAEYGPVDALALRLPSAPEIATFRAKGFVKLEGFLNGREAAQLRKAMDEALATFASSPNAFDMTAMADLLWRENQSADASHAPLDLEDLARAVRRAKLPRLRERARPLRARGKFLIDTSIWRRDARFAEFALRGPLGAAVASLLGAEEIRFFDDQLFVKEAGALDKAAFHQDLSYCHLDGGLGCAVWIPLDPVRRGSGAMGYVPGSHRWPGVYNPNILASTLASPGSDGADLPGIETNPERFGVTYMDADPGDVVIHHFLTVHGSEGNTSLNARRAFSLRYCDGAMRYRRRAGAPVQPLHPAGMTDGHKLDSIIHPIVFRRKRSRR